MRTYYIAVSRDENREFIYLNIKVTSGKKNDFKTEFLEKHYKNNEVTKDEVIVLCFPSEAAMLICSQNLGCEIYAMSWV